MGRRKKANPEKVVDQETVGRFIVHFERSPTDSATVPITAEAFAAEILRILEAVADIMTMDPNARLMVLEMVKRSPSIHRIEQTLAASTSKTTSPGRRLERKRQEMLKSSLEIVLTEGTDLPAGTIRRVARQLMSLYSVSRNELGLYHLIHCFSDDISGGVPAIKNPETEQWLARFGKKNALTLINDLRRNGLIEEDSLNWTKKLTDYIRLMEKANVGEGRGDLEAAQELLQTKRIAAGVRKV